MVDKRERLLEKLKRSPHNATFADVRSLLEQEDFVLERITGSHHIFRRGSTIFVVPTHRNKVKPVYIKRLIEIIEEDAKR